MSACADLLPARRPLFRPAAELCALAGLLATLAALTPAHWRPAAASDATHTELQIPPGLALTLAEIRDNPRFAHALWLDARPHEAYAAAHVPGALRFTEAEWEALLPALLDRWEPGAPIIVYCDSAACGTSARIAARLRLELSDDNIHALQGGWPAWSPAP